MGANTAFRGYVHPLDTVRSFCYIGPILTSTDYDLPEVLTNIHNERWSWDRLLGILGWESADARMLGRLYLSII